MANDDSFLRAIAERPADDLPRMVYADWLEEQGNAARAEFIRVQCELATPKLAKASAKVLKTRERELLDAHRQEWIAALGVPIEDVRFERGVIAAARVLEPKRLPHPQLAALVELDLSGLGLDDSAIAGFAIVANLPALKKLMLNGNAITDEGAICLMRAKGLPAVDTLYLFDNPVNDVVRTVLKRFGTPDLGQPAEGYEFTPGQTDVARRQWIRQYLLPCVTGYFEKYPLLQSAMLCVAQYWADEADDAVHEHLMVSELPEPDLKNAQTGFDDEAEPDPNVPNTVIPRRYYDQNTGSGVDTDGVPWDDNSGAIPYWAAFAPEGGSQEYGDLQESYAPAVMFYRHGGYDILPMQRPHLDGIRPEWSNEE